VLPFELAERAGREPVQTVPEQALGHGQRRRAARAGAEDAREQLAARQGGRTEPCHAFARSLVAGQVQHRVLSECRNIEC
jgi:hypothetical protein